MGRIVVEGLGKKYKRYPNQWARLAEILSGGQWRTHREHWALRGVSFQVSTGEAVGIIGENGAGKSTLLKILTGTTQPTEGRAVCEGQVAALLELGMGFHQDFTGWQNATMGLQLRGLSAGDIAALLPEVAAFSELEDHMDQPFRTYSSGMQMRLAFSVATAVRSPILIVDEALSVGDAYFQHKSTHRIREYKRMGTTLLFVSHDPGAVKTLCERALLLDKGVLIQDGSPDAVLDYYNALISKRERTMEIRQLEGLHGRPVTRSGTRRARIIDAELLSADGQTARVFQVGEHAVIRLRVATEKDLTKATLGILLRDRLGNSVFGTNTYHLGYKNLMLRAGERIEARFTVQLNLGPGNYALTVAVHAGQTHLEENFDWWDNVLAFQVIPGRGPYLEGTCALPVAVNLEGGTADVGPERAAVPIVPASGIFVSSEGESHDRSK
jgi:lipopolysaccharide transport system ATP-binding protein